MCLQQTQNPYYYHPAHSTLHCYTYHQQRKQFLPYTARCLHNESSNRPNPRCLTKPPNPHPVRAATYHYCPTKANKTANKIICNFFINFYTIFVSCATSKIYSDYVPLSINLWLRINQTNSYIFRIKRSFIIKISSWYTTCSWAIFYTNSSAFCRR